MSIQVFLYIVILGFSWSLFFSHLPAMVWEQKAERISLYLDNMDPTRVSGVNRLKDDGQWTNQGALSQHKMAAIECLETQK